ncbi:hypothetical protein PanWU01x14_111670 [Parasponia andersonii]|uniref:Uncharacterized protein n=1 Tax=Parasponia andersonii TaxID=3476 RepID=A0A2P5CYK9_PARAD|nr:hypothetical protein PanWU01x14_111670 [Parasponia andersonii]
MRRSPEFLLKTIMFSFVGTNPQLAKVDTVVKIEKYSFCTRNNGHINQNHGHPKKMDHYDIT